MIVFRLLSESMDSTTYLYIMRKLIVVTIMVTIVLAVGIEIRECF